ncbi:uncharacterized protein [Aristolochia californica]|uniref:uncharacterized protein isoform X3 n=1 Tax=Aristolochia californica TaxID=171875 RepID=UPI0035DAB468
MRSDGPVREEGPDIEKQGKEEDLERGGSSSQEQYIDNNGPSAVKILISQVDRLDQVSGVKGEHFCKTLESEKAERTDTVAPKKMGLVRADSVHEQCRVCQQQSEEALMDLGCHCRGELAKAHRSCIDMWFRTRGSNKCEICQQVTANVPIPEPLPSTNYWVWRIEPTFGASDFGQERERSYLDCILDSYWWTLIGCPDIHLSWSFCSACQHHNRCSHCAGTRNCYAAGTGMLP